MYKTRKSLWFKLFKFQMARVPGEDDSAHKAWNGEDLYLMSRNMPKYNDLATMSGQELKAYMEKCWQEADDAWDMPRDQDYWHVVAHLKWQQAMTFVVTGVFLHPMRNLNDTPYEYAMRLEKLITEALDE